MCLVPCPAIAAGLWPPVEARNRVRADDARAGPHRRKPIWRIFIHTTYARSGETQAAAYTDTLVARFKWLTVNRSLCQPRDDLRPGLCGRTEGAHLTVFREGGDHVQIVRILHRHMDPARHPEG